MKRYLTFQGRVLSLLLITMFTIFISSCNKKNTESDYTKFDNVAILNKPYAAVNVMNYNKLIPIEQSKIYEATLVKNSLYADLVNNSFLKLIDELKQNFSGEVNEMNSELSTVILYCEKGYDYQNWQSVKAFSTLKHYQNRLEHRLYEVKNGVVVEIKKFHLIGDYIHKGEIRTLLNLFCKSKDAGYVMLTNLTSKNIFPKYPKYESVSILPNTLEDGSTLNVQPGGNCGSGGWSCDVIENTSCKYNGQDWGCTIDIISFCKVAQINNVLTENQELGYDQLSKEKAYSFRDNFMTKYEVGMKYIGYFYKLSEFSFNNNVVNINSISLWYNFALKVYDVSHILQYGNSDDIVVTENFKNNALEKINMYRAYPNVPTEIKNILDKIEADLNHFVGKTRQQILSEIN